METYNIPEIIKVFKKLNICFFSLADFAKLFRITNRNTIYKKIQRLEKKGIIQKLAKGKYWFCLALKNDFLLANFLYQPSYISLESALSFYGIITGFPYQITSVTPKKTKSFKIDNKDYIYSKIDKNLFWGYEKKENFLIAEKEKAIFDYLYLASKGLRSSNLEEFDFSLINKSRLKNYLKKESNKNLLKFIKILKL